MTAPWINQRPKNPSKWDDEFETDLMHPKWTPAYSTTVAPLVEQPLNAATGSSTFTLENAHRFKPSWWCRQDVAAGVQNNTAGYGQDISDVPRECIFVVRGGRGSRRTSASDGDSEFMMRMLADNLTDYCLIMWDSFASIVSPLFARAAPTSQGLAYLNLGILRNYFTFGEPAEYIAMQKRNNTWDGWAASSAGNWVHLGSFTHTVPLTRVNLTMGNITLADPGATIAGIDFFRVYEGTKLP